MHSLPYSQLSQYQVHPPSSDLAAAATPNALNFASTSEAEAFARAFEQAEQAFEVQETIVSPGVHNQITAHPPASEQDSTPRIGSDLIPGPIEQDSPSQSHSTNDMDDELAKVAGNLLEKVQDDSSTKFRESNFLSLMRQLRDREVRVEGEKIVNANVDMDSTGGKGAWEQELHPGGDGYPEGGYNDPVFMGVEDGETLHP